MEYKSTGFGKNEIFILFNRKGRYDCAELRKEQNIDSLRHFAPPLRTLR